MDIIAHIHTDFPTKFGVPRQSGLAGSLQAAIVFEPPYRSVNAIRGIEGFSHLWLIWQFHKVPQDQWQDTVLPPKLGGKTRVGVFATRSPFRPNHMGLSCVKLERVQVQSSHGPILYVSGADLVDGTPIYDIKPYLPYADSIPDAVDGFAELRNADTLQVEFPEQLLQLIPEEKREGLCEALSLGPIPGYQHDPERRYGFGFAGFDVRFRIKDGVLTVVEVVKE